MKRTQDLKAQYQLQMDEEGILLAAATILERRLQRQGRIQSPDQAGDYLVARCAHLPHEVFGAVFLDNKHHIISTEHLFSGTVDGCDVHPRVVAKRALELNAVAVVLFHNHPSGNPEPSEADRKVTERLKQALALLDIRVLDHLVIGGRQHTSLAARGGHSPPLHLGSLPTLDCQGRCTSREQEMKAFHVRGIVWGTDGKRPALPAEATVECDSEDGIANALSDAFGWLVSDFTVVEELEELESLDGAQRRNTTMSNEPKRGEFFQVQPDARRGGKGHGVVFENEKVLRIPPRLIVKPKKGGFPPLRETPRLVYHPSEGVLPEDLEGGFSGYWLVSERLRRVMESVDAEAFAFADADYRLADGSKGPTVFLCDVVRTLDALDEEASELNIEISDDFEAGKYYDLTGDIRLAFRRDVLGSAHVFRLSFHGGVFCDRAFKEAVEAAGIVTPSKSNGLWFYDVVNC